MHLLLRLERKTQPEQTDDGLNLTAAMLSHSLSVDTFTNQPHITAAAATQVPVE